MFVWTPFCMLQQAGKTWGPNPTDGYKSENHVLSSAMCSPALCCVLSCISDDRHHWCNRFVFVWGWVFWTAPRLCRRLLGQRVFRGASVYLECQGRDVGEELSGTSTPCCIVPILYITHGSCAPLGFLEDGNGGDDVGWFLPSNRAVVSSSVNGLRAEGGNNGWLVEMTMTFRMFDKARCF